MLKTKEVIYLIILFIAIIICYNVIDIRLTKYLYVYKDTTFTHIFKYITKLGDSTIYMIATTLVTIVLYLIKSRYKLNSLFVTISLYITYFVTGILKVTLAKARPIELFTHDTFGFIFFKYGHNFNSMPSGHTTITIATVFTLYYLNKKYFVPLMLFALLITISRIIVLDHYISDVLLSWLVAYIIVKVVYNSMTKRNLINLN